MDGPHHIRHYMAPVSTMAPQMTNGQIMQPNSMICNQQNYANMNNRFYHNNIMNNHQNGIMKMMGQSGMHMRPNQLPPISLHQQPQQVAQIPTMMQQQQQQQQQQHIMQQNYAMENNPIQALYQIGIKEPPVEFISLEVCNGNVLGPTLIKKDQPTELTFDLDNMYLKQILERSDLDILLLCRVYTENISQLHYLIWPPESILTLNNQILQYKNFRYVGSVPLIEPILIKNQCCVGKNVLKIDFTNNYSNLQLDSTKLTFKFHIYMVHRPTLSNAVNMAKEKSFVTIDVMNKLLRQYFTKTNRNAVGMSRICPLSNKQIDIPLRFSCCEHIQPVDLFAFYQFQARWMLDMCPLCWKSVKFNFNGLEKNIIIDEGIIQLFRNSEPNINRFVFHSDSTIVAYNDATNTSKVITIDGLNNFHVSSYPIPTPPPLQQQPPTSNSISPYHMQQQQQQFIQKSPIQNQSPIQNSNYSTIKPPPIYNNNNNTNDQKFIVDFNPITTQSPTTSLTPINTTITTSQPTTTTTITTTNIEINKKPVCNNKKSNQTTKKLNGELNNTTTMNGGLSNSCCNTPQSTHTSSVASTSSPDSLNVPQNSLKRPNSDELLSSNQHNLPINDEIPSSNYLVSMTSNTITTNTNITSYPFNMYHPQQQQYHSTIIPSSSSLVSMTTTAETMDTSDDLNSMSFKNTNNSNNNNNNSTTSTTTSESNPQFLAFINNILDGAPDIDDLGDFSCKLISNLFIDNLDIKSQFVLGDAFNEHLNEIDLNELERILDNSRHSF